MWFKSLNDLPAISSRPPVLSAAHPAKRVAPVAVDPCGPSLYRNCRSMECPHSQPPHRRLDKRPQEPFAACPETRHKTPLNHVEVGGDNNMCTGQSAGIALALWFSHQNS